MPILIALKFRFNGIIGYNKEGERHQEMDDKEDLRIKEIENKEGKSVKVF